jgi:predicted ATP-grasp superfamily ATP-dependent carboligase
MLLRRQGERVIIFVDCEARMNFGSVVPDDWPCAKKSAKNVGRRRPGGTKHFVKAPVLILGWIPRIVLTIARSLHRHGIPVDVADCVMAPAVPSRAVRHFFRLPYPNNAPRDFANELRAAIARGGYDLLIPADDVAIATLMENYGELNQVLRIACPPPEITQRVLNKPQTLEVAQSCGMRVPRTMLAEHSGMLREFAERLPFPWILKPAGKEKRFEEFTSFRVNTLSEIEHKYPTPRKFEPPMLVQEYCEGVGVGVQMLLHQGECLAVFQHRRLKELPFGGGVAVTAIAESPNPQLVDSSLKLLRALEWDGVAMVEYRVNRTTGEAVLMEVNGRFWGTVSLAVSAGLDLPYYQWQLLHGEQPSISKVDASGKRWRWSAGYFTRLYRMAVIARQSDAARRELKRTLLQMPADFSPFVGDALFRFSDPVPAILESMQTLLFWAQHSVGALHKRMPPSVRPPSTEKATRI